MVNSCKFSQKKQEMLVRDAISSSEIETTTFETCFTLMVTVIDVRRPL